MRESGGLLTLEAINLLKTVLVKAESVLLERNLKSYTQKNYEPFEMDTYLDEQMNVQIGTSGVFLV